MINPIDVVGLQEMERGQRFGLVVIHRSNNPRLVELLEPISGALQNDIYHINLNKGVLEWIDIYNLKTWFPVVLFYKPGKSRVVLYQPKLQDVVNLCLGRSYNADQE